MSSTSKRFIKGGVLLGLAAAALAGCAVTTSGAAGRASVGPGYAVCSGGHASRFPEHAEIGRVCRPVASTYAIY